MKCQACGFQEPSGSTTFMRILPNEGDLRGLEPLHPDDKMSYVTQNRPIAVYACPNCGTLRMERLY